jgi:hypothetical protein
MKVPANRHRQLVRSLLSRKLVLKLAAKTAGADYALWLLTTSESIGQAA